MLFSICCHSGSKFEFVLVTKLICMLLGVEIDKFDLCLAVKKVQENAKKNCDLTIMTELIVS